MSQHSPDVTAHRDWLTSWVELPDGGEVVDFGCGAGDALLDLAKRASTSDVRFVGVDRSESAIAKAQARATAGAAIDFTVADLAVPLPFGSASIEVAYSNNYLECVPDVDAFVHDVARILRPGGQVVFGHWDWDTQVFNGEDKVRIRQLVHAFADWQQDWMDHADGWLGRRLSGVFGSGGLFDGVTHARTMVNTEYGEPWYGYARAQDFRALAKRDLVPPEDVEGFLGEQEALAAAGRYCYSITGYVYVGRARAT